MARALRARFHALGYIIIHGVGVLVAVGGPEGVVPCQGPVVLVVWTPRAANQHTLI